MEILAQPVVAAVVEALPFAVAWNAVFWVFRCGLSGLLFPKTVAGMNSSNQSYLAASMVSTIHAFVVVCMACRTIHALGLYNMFADVNLSSPESAVTLRVMLGYILQDLIVALYYNNRWPGWVANLVHHVAVAVTWSICLGLGVVHTAAVFGGLLELTSPFINLFWFLRTAGMQESTLFVVNGFLLLFLWTIFRVGFYTRVVVSFIQGWEQLLSLPSLGGGLPAQLTTAIVCSNFLLGYILQLMWWSRIVKGALKSLKPSKVDSKNK